MKTLINNLSKDFVIEQSYRVEMQSGENYRAPQWVDEKAGTVKHLNYAQTVVFYEDEYKKSGRTSKAIRVELKATDILKLAEKIKEINESSFIDIFDFD